MDVPPQQRAAPRPGGPAHTTLMVDGMDCAGCARTISAAVERMPRVTGVEVSFATGRMLVEHDRDGFDAAAVARLVERLGFQPRAAEEAELQAASRRPGPRPRAGDDAAPLGASRRPGFLPRAGGDAPQAVSHHQPGFPPAAGHAAPRGARHRRLGRHTLTYLATALLLLAVAADFLTDLPAAWLYGAAAAAGIWPIARSGLVALWTTRRPEIKLLMTIAVVGAAAIGAWMEAALVVVLFSIGELLEGRAVARARRELAGLVALAPERARIRTAGGEVEVAAATLVVGDVVIVRPGERLPADGTVIEGGSAVDQAPITGESVPVDKAPGDRVFAGTLNAQGRLVVAVEAAPGDTTLARIGRLVADAQARRSPSERWVDAFARVYTPAVIVAAVLVAAVPPLAWGASFDGSFYSALALLILACPCALVLSTPVTIVSALGRASAAGVLVKGGEQLERAAAIDTVAFDKTGTLTAGTPRLVAVDALGGDPGELLALAAALEAGSEHPLAAAIVAAAREQGLPLADVEDFEARAGFGATGRVGGRAVAIGKPAMFDARTLTPAVERALAARRAEGQTAVVVVVAAERAVADERVAAERVAAAERAVAVERVAAERVAAAEGAVADERVAAERVLGVLGLADPPRPEAREATAQLARLGIERTVLVTGDNAATAAAVARAVGVAEVRSEALPEDKARLVDGLGGRVAMVGDGVNDAPALASASLGIAMGSAGSDTAIEVADVALMGDDPRKVAALIGLARWTRATVRANIAFALATKLAAAVLLAFGLLPLWAAVVTDVGASLVVVLWGLRVLVGTPGGRMRGMPILTPARRTGEAPPAAAAAPAGAAPAAVAPAAVAPRAVAPVAAAPVAAAPVAAASAAVQLSPAAPRAAAGHCCDGGSCTSNGG